jgi:hypothetical protein
VADAAFCAAFWRVERFAPATQFSEWLQLPLNPADISEEDYGGESVLRRSDGASAG